jgi:two-component system NtrC family sensor kinase
MNNSSIKDYLKILLSDDSRKAPEEKKEVFYSICSVMKAKDEWEKAVDVIEESIIIIDDNKRIRRINKTASRLIGVPIKEIIGQKYCDLICGNQTHNDCIFSSKMNSGLFFSGECGSLIFPGIFFINAYSISIDDHSRVIMVLRDITKEKSVTSELIHTKEKYQSVIENAFEGILIIEISTENIIFANPALCAMFGYTRQELEKMNFTDIHPPDLLPRISEEFKAMAAGRKKTAGDIPFLKKDRSIVYADITGSTVDYDGKHCVIGFLSDITERKKLEDQVNRKQWQLQSIVDCSASGVLIVQNKKITFANRTAGIILGYRYEDLLEADFLSVFSPENEKLDDSLLNRINDNSDYLELDNTLEYNILRGDGSTCWVTLKGLEIAIDQDLALLISIIDIQKIKEVQLSLIQNEKLVTMGQLASGVAHEINNPLAYIMSNLRSLSEYITIITGHYKKVLGTISTAAAASGTADFKKDMEQIIKYLEQENTEFFLDDSLDLISASIEGAQRIAGIVSDIKSFSHMDKEEDRKFSSINSIIKAALNIVWNQLKYTSDVNTQLESDLPGFVCNSQQLIQVFINLLINASQAIQSEIGSSGTKTRGNITIITRLKPGKTDTIQAIVQDNGCGMPDNIKASIFNPFFTTKEADKGTGLGMSITLDIIKKHMGSVTFTSVEHEGTTFVIELPANNSESENHT